jgi:ABC-2 type transport system ATP-binding protein
VETGSLAELRHLTRTTVEADLAGPPDGLENLPGVHDAKVSAGKFTGQVDTDHLDGLLKGLAAVGVKTLVSRPPTLEELFLRHYEPEGAQR